ncbi:tyrosine-type recombinase/integrase [Effusibacillus consociatus]|uniref:Tyrosine-type recombinase/integrase n=1 Tax=Effusibacillus consociatus TaxID=1117041 RepID=A0ABV9PY31_9BACL
MAKKRITNIQTVTCTWEEAFKEFLLWKKAQGISETTLKDYRGHVKSFFKRFPDCWQEPNLKKSVLEYMADDVKPATFNLRLAYLRAFFDWCVGERYLQDNPLQGIKKRKAQPRIVDIPQEKLQKLLTLPDQRTFSGLRDYALICLTLDTGIRPKEAFQLTVEDIDLQHMKVTVPAEVAKTRTARSIDITPTTAEVIRKLMNVRPDWWGVDVPIFCSNEGNTVEPSFVG